MDLTRFIGSEAKYSFEHRILNTILLFGTIFAIVTTLNSYMLRLGTAVVSISLTNVLIIFVLYYQSLIKRRYKMALFCIVFFVVFVITPLLWLTNGGLAGGTAFFMPLFSSCLAALLRGGLRIGVIVGMIVLVVLMIVGEYHNPAFISGYASAFERYSDTGFSLVINIAANAILLTVITQQYMKKERKVRLYEAQIEQQKIDLLTEQFFRVFNTCPEAKSIRRVADWRTVAVNDAWVNCFGYRREEVLETTADEINLLVDKVSPEEMERDLGDGSFLRELQMRTKGGELRDILLSNVRIDFNGEECALFTLIDITEIKKYERKLAQLERLNLVGEMAASIGHEVRNPLTTVRGFLQLIEKRSKCPNEKERYNIMIGELDRANSIISEFLSLAKNRTINLRLVQLNNIIEALNPLLCAAALRDGCEVLLELESVPEVFADADEIRQLVLNLVRNAIEAMSEGGRIVLATRLEGDAVVFSVRDTGEGIPLNIFEKLGTPFFTTKDTGTGLGLAICYRIAERHSAKVTVETGCEGTTFLFEFPAILQEELVG